MSQQAERREEQLEDEIATLQVEREPGIGTIVPVTEWCQCMLPAHVAPFPLHPSTVWYSMIQCGKVQYGTVYILFTAGGAPHTKGALLGRHTLSAEY